MYTLSNAVYGLRKRKEAKYADSVKRVVVGVLRRYRVFVRRTKIREFGTV